MPTNKFEDTILGRPGTVRVTLSLYRNWVEPHRLNSIQEKVAFWQTNGLAPRTIQTLISIAAREEKYRTGTRPETRSISMMIGRSEVKEEGTHRALTRKEAEKIIKSWEERWPLDVIIPILGLHAGLRLGEVMGLRWKDVDFLNSVVHIRRSYEGPTKNGKSRQVPMSKALEKSLTKTDNYVSADQESKVVMACDVNRKLKKVCQDVGVPAITFHAFRHTFATLAIQAGTDLKAVSEALGHSQVSTTVNTYYHLLQKRMTMDFLDD